MSTKTRSAWTKPQQKHSGASRSSNDDKLISSNLEQNEYFAIVADIGGTNSRFQLYSVSDTDLKQLSHGQKAGGKLVFQAQYKNEDYTSKELPFSHVIKQFIFEANHVSKPLHVASIAVAGFVVNNAVNFTNNKAWSVVGEELAKELGVIGEVRC
jgi:glucokinase